MRKWLAVVILIVVGFFADAVGVMAFGSDTGGNYHIDSLTGTFVPSVDGWGYVWQGDSWKYVDGSGNTVVYYGPPRVIGTDQPAPSDVSCTAAVSGPAAVTSTGVTPVGGLVMGHPIRMG